MPLTFRSNAKQTLGAENSSRAAILLGAAAPRYELRPEQRILPRSERLRRNPVEATISTNGADKDAPGHVHVWADAPENFWVVMYWQPSKEYELRLRNAVRWIRRHQRNLDAQLRLPITIPRIIIDKANIIGVPIGWPARQNCDGVARVGRQGRKYRRRVSTTNHSDVLHAQEAQQTNCKMCSEQLGWQACNMLSVDDCKQASVQKLSFQNTVTVANDQFHADARALTMSALSVL